MAEHERSSAEIRRDIDKEEETISRTVEQIGERIKDKFDWRAQVKESPYWALGAATGLGFFAAKIIARRASPMERILGPLAEEVRGSLDGQFSGGARTGLITMTLLGIATRSAANWIKQTYQHDSGTGGAARPRPRTGQDSHVDPETAL